MPRVCSSNENMREIADNLLCGIAETYGIPTKGGVDEGMMEKLGEMAESESCAHKRRLVHMAIGMKTVETAEDIKRIMLSMTLVMIEAENDE